MGGALRGAGHDVLLAIDVREAFVRLSEGGIDVVVFDSYDPRIGIVDFARALEQMPETPPLVLVSSSPHAPEISARIGAAAFLPKPFEPVEILNAVARLVAPARPVRHFDDEEPTGPARLLG